MIGFYVHHQGHGHMYRALAIARALDLPVTGLSSHEPPEGWPGDWVHLSRDDMNGENVGNNKTPQTTGISMDTDVDVDANAGGRLHFVPYGNSGLCERMAQISQWIVKARPKVVVVDVSVEVACLVRLHGVPVITVVVPGYREDEAHQFGFGISSALLGSWPSQAAGMVTGLSRESHKKFFPVGAISRFPVLASENHTPNRKKGNHNGGGDNNQDRTVVLINGSGGQGPTHEQIMHARGQTPEWKWVIAGGPHGQWVNDVFSLLRSATVVVTHAGEGAVSDISAVRRPAVVFTQSRPYEEQVTTAHVLERLGLPVIVRPSYSENNWGDLLETARLLNGEKWAEWNDGEGASRAASIISQVANKTFPVMPSVMPPNMSRVAL